MLGPFGHVRVENVPSTSNKTNNHRIGGLHLCNTCAWLQILSTRSHVSLIFAENQQHPSTRALSSFEGEATTKCECLVRITNGFGFVKFFEKLSGHIISLRLRAFNSPVNLFIIIYFGRTSASHIRAAFWIQIVAKCNVYMRAIWYIHAFLWALSVEDKSWKINPRWV